MKRPILILFILANSLSLFAQSSMSDLYKQWLIEDINKGKFDKAAQEITHIEDWTYTTKTLRQVDLELDFQQIRDFLVYIDTATLNVDECKKYNFIKYLAKHSTTNGLIYSTYGQLTIALEYHEFTADILKSTFGPNDSLYVSSLYPLISNYRSINDYEKAELYAKQVLNIEKKDFSTYISCIEKVLDIFVEMGDISQVEYYLQEAQKYVSSNEDKEKMLSVYYSIAETCATHTNKKYFNAEYYYNKALELSLSLPNSYWNDLIYQGLGSVAFSKGDFSQSEYYYKEAFTLQKEQGWEVPPVLKNIAELYARTGQKDLAEQCFREYITIFQGNEDEMLCDFYLFDMPDDKKAEPYCLRADNPLKIGWLYESIGNYDKAASCYKEALEIIYSDQGENSLDYEFILEILGGLNIKKKEYSVAEQYLSQLFYLCKKQYVQTIEYMTERQRETYWNRIQHSFQRLIPSFAYKCHEYKPPISSFAYNNELFTKGVLLNSINEIKQSILSGHDTQLQRVFDEFLSLKKVLIAIQDKDSQSSAILIYQHQLDSLEKVLTINSAKFRQSKEQWNITWDSVRNHLNKDQVAIEYMVAPLSEDSTMYCALLLRNNSQYPEMIPLFEEKEVLSLLNTEVDSATNNTYNYSARGAELSQKIWSKILPFIKPGETIFFAPSGLLHQVAIEALPYDEDHTMADMFNLVRLSSTREIVLRKEETHHTTATLYGGIQYTMDTTAIAQESRKYVDIAANRSLDNDTLDRGGIKPLPWTETEVTTINKLLKDNHLQAHLFTTTNANEESFKALSGKHQNILHIATHGFYWSDSTAHKKDYFSQRMLMMDERMPTPPTIDPLNRCGLLFAGAQTAWSGHSSELPEGVQDGILTAKEISLLDLRDADLVVLSACETGKGEITGEGVFGLQRAFKQAGAQTIIMSLWPVDDKATQLLMTEFYRNWITNHQSKREAFKNAQNAVRNAVDEYGDRMFQAPVFWAGFIMLD